MTIQEARNEVAIRNGHGDWLTLVFRENLTSVLLLDAEAAELYAQSQVNEAVNKAIMLIADDILILPQSARTIIEELKKLKR